MRQQAISWANTDLDSCRNVSSGSTAHSVSHICWDLRLINYCRSNKGGCWRFGAYMIPESPVTTKSIVKFDTWFELFGVIRKKKKTLMTLAKMAAEVKIRNGHRRPYWKCNLKTNMHRNLCSTLVFTKCSMEDRLWHHFCILTSLNIKIKHGRRWPYWKYYINAEIKFLRHWFAWLIRMNHTWGLFHRCHSWCRCNRIFFFLGLLWFEFN